jgi:hypothetical protein
MMPGAMGMPSGQNLMPMGTPSGQNFVPTGTTGTSAFLGNPYAFSGAGLGSSYLMSPGYGYSPGYGASSGYGSSQMMRSGYSGNYSPMMSQGGYSSSGAGRVGGTQQGSSVQRSGLDWPLGTRLLADGELLRKDIDASVRSLLSQADQGRVDPELKRKTIRDIGELRAMIVQQGTRGVVSDNTIESAVRFLDDLASALRSL